MRDFKFNLSFRFMVVFQVDVVFEEDKGFWAAVGSFMQNAKCPIIMTSDGKNIIEVAYCSKQSSWLICNCSTK